MMSRLLLASVLALGLTACRHGPDERARTVAPIHYDLGVQAQQSGDVQAAFREYSRAVELDPNLPEVHNALGMLLHLAFQKPEQAAEHYRRAIEIRKDFSEAKVNFANLHLAEERYDAAISLYREALNDMLYQTPFIAQGNLGWALYKKGEVESGMESIRMAITTNPKFCQGFRNLALIYEEQNNARNACPYWSKYQEACPDRSEAFIRHAMCAAKVGDRAAAEKALSACVETLQDAVAKEECKQKLEQLSPQTSPSTPSPRNRLSRHGPF
ncbi:MAG: social motility TPR repeat lipoprotein Tgl [Myxococcaceae bacterium]